MNCEQIMEMAEAVFQKVEQEQSKLENRIFLDGLQPFKSKESVYCSEHSSQESEKYA